MSQPLLPSQRRFLQSYLDRHNAIYEALEESKLLAPGHLVTISISDKHAVAIEIEIARAALRTQQASLEVALKKMGIAIDAT